MLAYYKQLGMIPRFQPAEEEENMSLKAEKNMNPEEEANVSS